MRSCARSAGLAATSDGSTPTQARQDTFLVGHLDLDARRTRAAGRRVRAALERSNSYGDALTRHCSRCASPTALPLGFYLAARGELILAQLPQSGLARPEPDDRRARLSIDDENRNSLRVDLSRTLTERLQLLARYTFYANEIGLASSVAHYRRQTLLLSLTFTLDN